MSEGLRTAIKTLFRQGDIVEIRCLGGPQVGVGRYPLGWDLVRALEAEDKAGRDCYYVLNPTGLPPIPIGIDQNATKELEVPMRRWFLLDFDPRNKIRPSPDEDHAAALRAAISAKDYLYEQGWNGIVMTDSGNGSHLLVPIELPNTPEVKSLVLKVQSGVRKNFSNALVECECFPDANRMVRAYGTVNHKGVETETQKYRRSSLL